MVPALNQTPYLRVGAAEGCDLLILLLKNKIKRSPDRGETSAALPLSSLSRLSVWHTSIRKYLPCGPRTKIPRALNESHVEGVTALYNDAAVARQVLQMPFQSAEVWRQRIQADNERAVKLVALHQGVVIGHLGLEHYSRIRRSHAGSFGMGVATAWQGKGAVRL